MYTSLDYFLLVFWAVCFLIGWGNGLLYALIGPFSFFVFLIVGILYYDVTNNLITAIFVTSGGTIVLSILLTLLFFLSRRTVDKNFRHYVFWASRLLGGLLSLLWKGGLTMIVIFFISLLPPQLWDLERLQKNIEQSLTWGWFTESVIKQTPLAKNIFDSLLILKNPDQLKKIAKTPEYQNFISDEKIQELAEDEEVQELIEEENYSELIFHPKFLAILRDEELMKKISLIAEKVYQEKIKSAPPDSKDEEDTEFEDLDSSSETDQSDVYPDANP